MAGLEPARISPHAPQTCAYTDSATSTYFLYLIFKAMWLYRYTILYTARAVLTHPASPASFQNLTFSQLLAESLARAKAYAFYFAYLLSKRYSIVFRESLPHRHNSIKLSTKIILTQKFFCYKCYIYIDIIQSLIENRFVR